MAATHDWRALREDARVTIRTTGDPDPDGRASSIGCSAPSAPWTTRRSTSPCGSATRCACPWSSFFGLNPFIERANVRHYRFLVDGLPDIAAGLRRRGASGSCCGVTRITGCCPLPTWCVRPSSSATRTRCARPKPGVRRSATSARSVLDRGRGRRGARQAAVQRALRGAHHPAAHCWSSSTSSW